MFGEVEVARTARNLDGVEEYHLCPIALHLFDEQQQVFAQQQPVVGHCSQSIDKLTAVQIEP